jgi:hypothetical protein
MTRYSILAGAWAFVLLAGFPLYSQAPTVATNSLVSAGHLSPFGRNANRAIGDRLVTPGKERVVLLGQLTLGSLGQVSNVQCTIEFPGKLRLDNLSNATSLIWNPAGGGTAKANLNSDQLGLIETLLEDSVDQFLSDEIAGMPRRAFTQSFRTPGAAAGSPAFDVVQVVTSDSAAGDGAHISKLYLFRSDTHLLDRVLYKTAAGRVQTAFLGWTAVNGQMIPMRVTRSVNGSLVMDLKLTGASVGPKLPDSMFGSN